MKFKIDENLPIEIAELLREQGHDALTAHEQNLSGKPDDEIAIACNREERAIITLDTDFADIRAFPPSAHHGVIVLRIALQDKAHVIARMRGILPLFASEQIDNRLWIIDETSVRIRE